jgi:virginiamycin B lyase
MRHRSSTHPKLAHLPAAALAVLLMVPASSAADPTPVGATTLYPLSTPAHALAMTFGPDGNLWFAGVKYGSESGSELGRVEPTGEVTEFPLPATKSYFYGARSITAGPDGALWFTDQRSNTVGRITTNGEISQFRLPTPASGPNAIVTGADGNLWFTEQRAGKIGRITTTGSITEFALRPGRRPAGITVGPDGNLWFAQNAKAAIGRITTAGSIKRFPLPNPKSRPRAIVAAADGNLWFTEGRANRIGRITPAGKITQLRVSAPFGTGAIATGPGGEIWFTAGYRIARANVGSISHGKLPTQMSCVDTSCYQPPQALTLGPEGSLWFGTGVEYSDGGGGTAIAVLNGTPGYVGKFAPAP